MDRRPSPLFWALLCLIAVVALFPYAWIVLTSLKARTDILTTPPVWVNNPNLSNYINLLVGREFSTYLLNSVIVGISSTLLALFIGTFAAFAFSRYKVPAGNHLFFYILATRLGPPVAYALPMYFICSKFGLLQTHVGVIVAHAASNLVMVVWMMKTFFDEIPVEIEEAARLDGCTEWQLFSKISVALALPGMVTAAIFVFIFSWNELLFAMILSVGKGSTFPAMIPSLAMHTGTMWGEVAAAAVVQSIPVIVFTFLAQKHLIRGLTFGAVKG